MTRVAIGADHGGFDLKTTVAAALHDWGYAVDDVGCRTIDPVDYPVYAARVAEQVAMGEAEVGIMIDGAGIGSAMVANKIRGVRAAPAWDVTSAVNAREHNHANLLTLGAGLLGPTLALRIVRTFLDTAWAPGRHARRVAMIDALDRP